MTALWLADAQATDRLGAALARTRPVPATVYLLGDLGAGKSTLARALLRALGVIGAIRSPTYTLVERYPLGQGGEAWHLDLYRIGDAGELEFLGLDGADTVLWLVEWPERGSGGLPAPDLSVALAVEHGGRRAQLSAGTQAGRDWLAAITAVLDAPGTPEQLERKRRQVPDSKGKTTCNRFRPVVDYGSCESGSTPSRKSC